jgi:uncharacterized protein
VIAVLMTIGVYGLVAFIVKMDDIGLWLMQRQGQGLLPQLNRKLGWGMVAVVPYLMRLLSILGTAAMFLVGGGIIAHGIPVLHHWITSTGYWEIVLNGLFGVLVGAICVAVITPISALLRKS